MIVANFGAEEALFANTAHHPPKLPDVEAAWRTLLSLRGVTSAHWLDTEDPAVRKWTDKALALQLAKRSGDALALDAKSFDDCATVEVKSGYVLKPRFGSSGRGRVRAEAATPRARRKLTLRGGAILERWVKVSREVAAQGVVDGDVRILGVTQGLPGPSGVPRAIQNATEDGLAQRARAVGHDVGRLLQADGYRGPFGVDVMEYEDGVRAPLEINPRYTLGHIALGLAEHHGLKAFYFGPRKGAAVVRFSALALFAQ